ncbi:MAG TPA: DNA polymerase III subunit gamma/tau [Balneolaceae bacterium]|nr:DNA polymerase III subunit gamma/tau [Balneolaceae bacterium]
MPQNYRALTRTYRPQSFDDIVSQEHVSNTLKNAIKQDRISHAYMFCGPRGVGKTTMARVLARTINSIDAGVDAESLNQTLNVVEIDAASNNKVDDIHHLRESVRIPPQNGRYKVFIVDEVHMLSKAAFNALLKTLEEPPAHAIFIFATTEPHKVLPTILSRVQRFDFKRISVDEIVDRLKAICKKEGITIDEESLHVIAKKADGALRDALGLMDQAIAFCGEDIQHAELIEALNVVGVDQLFTFISAVENKDSGAGLQLVDDLMKAGVDIQEFLSALTEHLRNLYVAVNSGRMHLVDATADTKTRYKETAKAFEEEDLMRMLHMVSEAQLKIRDVQQPRVHFEILLLKLIHMNRSRELSSLIEDLNQLKKNGGIQLTDRASEPTENPVNKTSEPESNAEEPQSESESEAAGSTSDNTQDSSGSGSEPGLPHTGNGSVEKMSVVREEQEDESPSGQKEPESGHTASDEQHSAEQEEPEPQKQSSHDPKTQDAEERVDEDEDEDDDFMMVKPTLGYAEGISSPQGVADQKEDVDTSVKEPYPEPVSIQSVDDLESHWRSFVNKVKDEAPRMLYMQVLRVSLKELKGNELIVAADTEFAINLFDENQQLLSELMKRTVGVRIRIKCFVERNEKKKETKSPYERFKELQKKDPHLKSVVDLFGAELDY